MTNLLFSHNITSVYEKLRRLSPGLEICVGVWWSYNTS